MYSRSKHILRDHWLQSATGTCACVCACVCVVGEHVFFVYRERRVPLVRVHVCVRVCIVIEHIFCVQSLQSATGACACVCACMHCQ